MFIVDMPLLVVDVSHIIDDIFDSPLLAVDASVTFDDTTPCDEALSDANVSRFMLDDSMVDEVKFEHAFSATDS